MFVKGGQHFKIIKLEKKSSKTMPSQPPMSQNTATLKNGNEDWDSTFQLMSWWRTEVVQNATVMVVGAGAIGNEVLKNLALLNVGQILIVDFDTIEYSNLSRSVLFKEEDSKNARLKCEAAADRVREINPNVKVKTINGTLQNDVGLGVFERVDAVIGCLDNRLARLTLNRYCFKLGKPWIDGAIEGLVVNVQVFRPGKACYECALTKQAWNAMGRNSCSDIAQAGIKRGRIPTTPISSSICAAIEVQEALKIIHGYDHLTIEEESFYYSGLDNLILQREPVPLKEICESHSFIDEKIKAPLGHQNTVAEFFEWLAEELPNDKAAIILKTELALKIVTQMTETVYDVLEPWSRIQMGGTKKYETVPNEAIMLKESIRFVDKNFDRLDLTLDEIGFPALDIIEINVDGKTHFVELSKDEDFMEFL